MASWIPQGARILFQGDSITDWGRDREDGASLGTGYTLMAAGQYMKHHPQQQVTFLNRGIGGDRTSDLLSRWQADCLELKPDVLSLLVGINDCWRRYDSNMPTSIEQFEIHYRSLLQQVKALGTKLIVMEPFLLPVNEEQRAWREDLDPKIGVVRELAREFEARFVPLDGLFQAAATRAPMAYWLPDGVHASPAGNALIAEAWLQAVQAE